MTETIVDILMVEDNRDDEELALLALRNYRVANRIHVARDGAEALEYLLCTGAHADRNIHNRPRVILLDLKLPKVDGIEVLRQIRADPRIRTIPVVALTSSREERDIVETYQLGINSYIVKPVDFEQFVEVVKQLGFYWLLLNKTPAL